MIRQFPNALEEYLAFTLEANLGTGNFSRSLALISAITEWRGIHESAPKDTYPVLTINTEKHNGIT